MGAVASDYKDIPSHDGVSFILGDMHALASHHADYFTEAMRMAGVLGLPLVEGAERKIRREKMLRSLKMLHGGSHGVLPGVKADIDGAQHALGLCQHSLSLFE